jgi:polysaccharide biosynthesis transport protein
VNDDLVPIADQVAVLRRRWRTIALCVLLVTAAAVGLALLQPPRYSSTAQVLVAPTTVSTATGQLEPEEIATQVEVIRSEPVADRVIRSLALRTGHADLLDDITVEQLDDTRVLAITASSGSPAGARARANAFARQYLEYRRELAGGELAAARDAISSQVGRVQAQLDQVQTLLTDASSTQRPRLLTQRRALMLQLAQAQSRLLDVVSEPGTSGGEVLVPAALPAQTPVPQILRAGLLGVALGLLLGIGAAFVRDRLDDAVRDDTRLRRLMGRPLLGRVPPLDPAAPAGLPTLAEPNGPASEAYRSLASNVRFLIAGADRSNRPGAAVLLVASAEAEKGTSGVAANLAAAAARFGMEVVLVDGNLRRSGVPAWFGLDRPRGFSEALSGHGELDDLLVGGFHEGLSVFPAGSPTPSAPEMLASPAAHEVFERLRKRADLIVVDSPPAVGVADTLELVREADLVVLVIRLGLSRGAGVQRAIEQIQQVGGDVAGTVYVDR